MKYINELEIKNKGFEVSNNELRKKVNDLKISLAMARGGRDYNEKLLFATQKEKKEIENKLTETEKQIEIFKITINNLTKENEELKREIEKRNDQQCLDLNTQTVNTNTNFQEMIINGLNFITKAMQYNQNSLQKIKN